MKTRSFTSSRYIFSAEDLEEYAMPLLDKVYQEDSSKTHSLRLMGVRLSHFKGSENLIEGQSTLSFKPQTNPNNVHGSQIQCKRPTEEEFVPYNMSDINEGVLSELPPDIVEEIRRELSAATSSSSSSSSSAATSSSSSSSFSAATSSSSSSSWINPPKNIANSFSFNKVKGKENAVKKDTGVDAREISEEILNELPLDVQEEIRRQIEMDVRCRKSNNTNRINTEIITKPSKRSKKNKILDRTTCETNSLTRLWKSKGT